MCFTRLQAATSPFKVDTQEFKLRPEDEPASDVLQHIGEMFGVRGG